MLKLAVLDIGSNSIHMILTEIQPDFSYKILDRFKDVPRLGEETFTTGSFSSGAIAKGTEVVRTLATLAHNRGFTRIEAVATSAVREAANGGDLIEAIEHETGIQVRRRFRRAHRGQPAHAAPCLQPEARRDPT